jgi:chromosomal replication initiation ATPase DnaA
VHASSVPSFETFRLGPTNRLAYAAALTVAERPERFYNPVLIYGPAGSGKSHLLTAISRYVAVHYPRLTVRLSAGTDVMRVREQPGQNVRPRWPLEDRRADVLLIDDLDAEVPARIADIVGVQIWRLTRRNRHQVVMTASTFDYSARSALLMCADLPHAPVVPTSVSTSVAGETGGRLHRNPIG